MKIELEIVKFNATDVITTSPVLCSFNDVGAGSDFE